MAQPVKLCSEHGAVGAPEQFIDGDSVAGIKGDPDAGRNADRKRPELARRGYGSEQLLGDGCNLVIAFDVEQEAHEFVAPMAADRVLRAQGALEPGTDHLEQLVAD